MANTPENPQMLRNILLRFDVGLLIAINVTGFLQLMGNLTNAEQTLVILASSGLANISGIGLLLHILAEDRNE